MSHIGLILQKQLLFYLGPEEATPMETFPGPGGHAPLFHSVSKRRRNTGFLLMFPGQMRPSYSRYQVMERILGTARAKKPRKGQVLEKRIKQGSLLLLGPWRTQNRRAQ